MLAESAVLARSAAWQGFPARRNIMPTLTSLQSFTRLKCVLLFFLFPFLLAFLTRIKHRAVHSESTDSLQLDHQGTFWKDVLIQKKICLF